MSLFIFSSLTLFTVTFVHLRNVHSFQDVIFSFIYAVFTVFKALFRPLIVHSSPYLRQLCSILLQAQEAATQLDSSLHLRATDEVAGQEGRATAAILSGPRPMCVA